MTDILFSAGDHSAARLHPDQDTAALQVLFEACADFSDLIEGQPPSATAAQETFTEAPPGKGIEDKFLIGIFDSTDRLLGVLETVRDYPQPGEWFIGLLLLDPACRGNGLGEKVCRAFEGWVREAGAQAVGLGVVEANEGAFRFWARMGFATIRKSPPRVFGRKEHSVIYMRRVLNTPT